MKHPLLQAEEWMVIGKDVAIATVIRTWGSSPNCTGSQLVIDETGNVFGSVSGGCIEGAVILEAEEVIASGDPKMLEFGVSDEDALEYGLSCGGHIQIYLERLG